MKKIKCYLWLGLLVCLSYGSQAQTHFVNQGHLTSGGGFVVLNNTQLANNGTINHSTGTLKMMGDAADANSGIGGSSTSAVQNLTVNKTANNVPLSQTVTVKGTVSLEGGHLDLQDHDLTVGMVTGATANRYIKTSGSGELQQEVGSSAVAFPIGNSSFNPLELTNTGTADVLGARVEDQVLVQLTTGAAVDESSVNRVWHLSETTEGGSNVTAKVQWNGSEELPNFDRSQAVFAAFENGAWAAKNTGAATGSNPHEFTGTELTTLGAFAVSNVVCATSSQAVLLLVDPESVGGSIAGDNTVCLGVNLSTLSLSGTVGEIQKWQSATDANFTNPMDIVQTNATYNAENLELTTYYRAIVKSGTCPAVFSPVATITVDATDEDGNEVPDCLEDCPADLDIMGVFGSPIAAGTYQASFTIMSDGNVQTGTEVIFKAGQSISLVEDFHAVAGSEFVAIIEACAITQTFIENNAVVEQARITLPNPIAQERLSLKVQPNPFVRTAQLYFRLPQADEVSVSIFDQSGRLVEQVLEKERKTEGDYYIRLTDENLYGGMFYVVLQNSTERIVKKMIVIKDARP